MKYSFPKVPENMPEALRPIGIRALTSAIDTLRPFLAQSSVLDLFAGQGRFGTAAALEGASRIVFVEQDAKAIHALTETSRKPFFPKATQVVKNDVFSYLPKASEQFDIVFCDPPFALWKEEFLDSLLANVACVLKPSSIFLVKCPSRMLIFSATPESALPKEFIFWKETEFGESKLVYFRYDKNEKDSG